MTDNATTGTSATLSNAQKIFNKHHSHHIHLQNPHLMEHRTHDPNKKKHHLVRFPAPANMHCSLMVISI
jgi:hypothetical protein